MSVHEDMRRELEAAHPIVNEDIDLGPGSEQDRYYATDARAPACTSALWAVMDRRGRGMDGVPITVASGLYPEEAADVAARFNSGEDKPVTAAQAAELAIDGIALPATFAEAATLLALRSTGEGRR
jgi:hypothetical protein